MSERLITVFVSATTDLEREREVVGEALARFPVKLPWRIVGRHTKESRPGGAGRVRRTSRPDGQDISTTAELAAAAALQCPLLVKRARTHGRALFRYNGVESWSRSPAPRTCGDGGPAPGPGVLTGQAPHRRRDGATDGYVQKG